MIWQDVALTFIAGVAAHAVYLRELARRRSGRSLRDAVLPKRKQAERPPSVTEVV